MMNDNEKFEQVYLNIINEQTNDIIDESLGKNLAMAALARINAVD